MFQTNCGRILEQSNELYVQIGRSDTSIKQL